MFLSTRRFLANTLIRGLPPTRFYALKRWLLRMGGVEVGAGARIVSSVRIWTSGAVRIGADTFIGHEVLVVGGEAPIVIGARCDLAPRVSLISGTHEEGTLERAAGAGRSDPITIGDGVWIGTGATVIAGSEIGNGTIVGAGSLVNGSIPAAVVAMGVPCRVMRARRTGAANAEIGAWSRHS
jgi:acetyltransferase-like isoleucine patch superfamily enzyme